ncbi:MAG: hypothetical protein Q4F95_13410 [Oscillospiraceae bacterium]|nr:hypothetical protein [Oscillospiraceae bacterium]
MLLNSLLIQMAVMAAGSPATGDQRNTTLPIVFGIIALVLIAGSIVAGAVSKKDKNNKKK